MLRKQGRGEVDKIVSKLLRDLKTGVYAIVMLNLILREGPIHGYGLRIRINALSKGMLNPSEGTVYETLKNLEKAGLIKSFWGTAPGRGPPRKYYVVTDLGREVISLVNEGVIALLRLIESVVSPEEGRAAVSVKGG